MDIRKTVQKYFEAERTGLPGQTHDHLYGVYLLHFNRIFERKQESKIAST
jgi:hypothetical protein